MLHTTTRNTWLFSKSSIFTVFMAHCSIAHPSTPNLPTRPTNLKKKKERERTKQKVALKYHRYPRKVKSTCMSCMTEAVMSRFDFLCPAATQRTPKHPQPAYPPNLKREKTKLKVASKYHRYPRKAKSKCMSCMTEVVMCRFDFLLLLWGVV
jgi:hypothetical protein